MEEEIDHKKKWDELHYRHLPDSINAFLRCQIGQMEVNRAGASIFHLLSYGETWEAAERLLAEKKKRP